jgi:hypothetical protein
MRYLIFKFYKFILVALLPFIFLLFVRPVYAFTFVSWGDTKDGTATLSAESTQAKTLNPNFTIYTGDLISSGTGSGTGANTLDNWKNALNGSTNNGTFDITFPVRGNHDTSTSTTWPTFFNLSGVASRIGATNYSELNKNATYSFDYGNSHFVGIDVTGDVSTMSAGQIAWLDTDLNHAEARGLIHAFLFWHGPIYAVDDHCCAIPPDDLIKVLNKHPIVSATFHGHEHVIAYAHLDGSRITGDQGTTLTHPFEEFVTGGGGASLYSCRSGRSDWCLAANSFATISVSGTSFTVNAYQLGNTTPIKTWTFNKSDPILIGAGDIVDPNPGHAANTAKLIQNQIAYGEDVHVFTAGDNTNDVTGYAPYSYYTTYFDPTWGLFKSYIRPSAGNHDYGSLLDGTKSYGYGYFSYFNGYTGSVTNPNTNGAAGLLQGWYSYNIGSWHIVVLNSNCTRADACITGPTDTSSTAQKWQNEIDWLTTDLNNNNAVCTAAIWHHPLYSSGQHDDTSSSFVKPLWTTLLNYGVDIVMNGHDHNYERFAPQNDVGIVDSNGITEFVVGTGGLANFQWGATDPAGKLIVHNNSQYLTANTSNTSIPNLNTNIPDYNGVLRLTLHPTSYDWVFLPIAGTPMPDTYFTDVGSANCVNKGVNSTVPTNLTASATSPTQVDLSWTAPTNFPNLVGYKIFRNGNQVGTSTTNSYSDKTVTPGTTYSYYVTAYDNAIPANNSGPSNTVPVTTPCPNLPTDKGKVTTSISISTAGTYKIWSRIMAPDATNNSYILQVVGNDCGTVVGDSNTAIAANTWTWVDYKDASASSKITTTFLTNGSYTINMIGRETGVKLDRVIFTTDQTCVPTGTGDNCLGLPPDIQPPVRSNGAPSGSLAAGTTQTTISLTTDEAANCKYSTTAGTSYTSMTNTFSTTGGTSHSSTVTGLANGTSYNYYIRCQDKASTPNANTDDYPISFSVSNASSGKIGDLNGDNKVDAADLLILVTRWGTNDATADLNKSGTVDVFDLSTLLSHWGT